MSYSIKIGHLFPDILNMYGDKGNVMALVSRMKWRGFDASVKEFFTADEIDLTDIDILILGGGSEQEDFRACDMLREKRDVLKEYIENEGVMLCFCGGYPVLGNYIKTKDKEIEGLKILDIDTDYGERFIGNVIGETEIFGEKVMVAGFENHGARINIKGYTPFLKVISGYGNNGKDKTSGIVYKNLIGTFLHGQLLPKNAKLCDYILSKALEKKYAEKIELPPLCDTLENEALGYCVEKFREKQ